jgi:hypothetical protein
LLAWALALRELILPVRTTRRAGRDWRSWLRAPGALIAANAVLFDPKNAR